MSLNKVMLIGNVGRDPEIRYLEGNAKVATFSLATTERYKDRNGTMQENTEWHSLVAWRNLADIVENYVKKGTQIYAEGRLRTREWTDQTGSKRRTTEVILDTLQLLGRKSDNPGGQGGYGQAPQGGYQQPQPSFQPAQPAQPAYRQPQPVEQAVDISLGTDSPDDDLPF